MKFVHAADIHLGSPLGGLDALAGAPADEVRGAPLRAFGRLVDLCIDEQAAFLLIAGDLFDGDCDFRTGIACTRELARLREAGIRVYVIRGNHDAAARMARQLPFPDNVHELDTARPEVVLDDELGVQVVGQGFARARVEESLVARYPTADPDYLSIGMLHTCLSGSPSHASYAPCSEEQLVALGYDYWALGHIHERAVKRAGAPWIVFPGNLQGRHARELGAKGATLVTVGADRRIVTVEHRDLDVLRWHHWQVAAAPDDSADDLIERIGERCAAHLERDPLPACVRVTLHGTTGAHAELRADEEAWLHRARNVAASYGHSQVWIERLKVRVSPPLPPLEQVRERQDPVGELARLFNGLRSDEAAMQELAGSFTALEKALPAPLRGGERAHGAAALAVRSADDLRQVLEAAEHDVMAQLLGSPALAAGSDGDGDADGGSSHEEAAR